MENKEINLNKEQREAVTYTEGPLLVIAGPGSGKTRTLVERVVHMLIEKKNISRKDNGINLYRQSF